MNLYKSLAFAGLLLGCGLSAHALENDTLFVKPDMLGNQYTLSLSNIQLKEAGSSCGVLVRRPYGTSTRGFWLELFSDRIEVNGTVVAKYLLGGLESHDYRIVRSSTRVGLYRDNVILANLPETISFPVSTSESDATSECTLIGCLNLAEGYSASLVSGTEAETVEESLNEDRIDGMLPVEFKNMVDDPYMTHGFQNKGLGAGQRIFYSNAASWTGWGPDAEFVREGAYSGGSCVKISGQAWNNGSVATGASLDLPLTLANGTTYLIRAMVKSEGYVGQIAISGENGCIPLTDTNGEWKQVEGLLTCTAARNTLYINNYDYVNQGTLYIDNIEVYRGYTASNVGMSTTNVAYLEIPKGRKYSSIFSRTVYMAGFESDGTTCAEFDTTGVVFHGASRYSRKVEGSKLYPVSFPGDLQMVTVTGSYDGYTYTEKPLFNGVDYILQKYVAPYFEYCLVDEPAHAGAYLIQFVDNLDGSKVSMTMGRKNVDVPEESRSGNPYSLVGNPDFVKYTPEGKFLRFEESGQRFVLTENEAVFPFEAYIATTSANPVNVIYPVSVISGFQQIFSEDGSRMSMYATEGGIVINSLDATVIDVYDLSGHKLSTWEVAEGSNFQSVPKGFYVIGGRKIIVNR